jgi:hypothetical protein
MTRRLAVVAAAIAAAAAFATAPANATAAPQGDTNGCVVIRPAQIAVCIPRF